MWSLALRSRVTAGVILFLVASAVFLADHFVRPALIGASTRLPFLWILLGHLRRPGDIRPGGTASAASMVSSADHQTEPSLDQRSGDPRDTRRNFLQQLNPFGSQCVLMIAEASGITASRAKLSTKPWSRGSATRANTIGMLFVCRNSAAVEGLEAPTSIRQEQGRPTPPHRQAVDSGRAPTTDGRS
jgi:hypothetical protein